MGGGSAVKHLPASAEGAGDVGSIPGLGRPLGERNGNPLQYSCLGSPRDRGARWATVYGVAKELDTTWRLHGNNKRHIGDSVCVCVCVCVRVRVHSCRCIQLCYPWRKIVRLIICILMKQECTYNYDKH